MGGGSQVCYMFNDEWWYNVDPLAIMSRVSICLTNFVCIICAPFLSVAPLWDNLFLVSSSPRWRRTTTTTRLYTFEQAWTRRFHFGARRNTVVGNLFVSRTSPSQGFTKVVQCLGRWISIVFDTYTIRSTRIVQGSALYGRLWFATFGTRHVHGLCHVGGRIGCHGSQGIDRRRKIQPNVTSKSHDSG